MVKAPVTRREAEVYVTKLEAARRQIDAAIRMYFANEDSLAINTVAAASYRLLRDLLEKRGKCDLVEALKLGLLVIAKKLVDGTLTRAEYDAKYGGNDYMWSRISDIADNLRNQGSNFTPDNLNIKNAKRRLQEDWNKLSKTSNFLKHADRDHETTLNLKDIDNEMLIYRAIAAYYMLSDQRTNEMRIYCMFHTASGRTGDNLNDIAPDALNLIKTLTPMTDAKRRNTCLKLLRKLDQIYKLRASQ